MNLRSLRRRVTSHIMSALCVTAVLVALVPLAFILFFVLSKGIGAINLDFFVQVWLPAWKVVNRPANPERHAAPRQHDDAHHGRGNHDSERFATRLVNANQVLVQEVNRYGAGNRDGSPTLDCLPD